jgi:hypothetical protein
MGILQEFPCADAVLNLKYLEDRTNIGSAIIGHQRMRVLLLCFISIIFWAYILSPCFAVENLLWSKSRDLLPVCKQYETASCVDCLQNNDKSRNITYNYCTDPSFCFLVRYNKSCEVSCKGDVVSEENDSQCPADNSISVAGYVVSFVFLVLCPVCLIFGCCYVCVVRCQNSSRNKIAADGPTVELQPIPLPLLQVYHPDAQNDGQQVVAQIQTYPRSQHYVQPAPQLGFVFAEARIDDGGVAASGSMPYSSSNGDQGGDAYRGSYSPVVASATAVPLNPWVQQRGPPSATGQRTFYG